MSATRDSKFKKSLDMFFRMGITCHIDHFPGYFFEPNNVKGCKDTDTDTDTDVYIVNITNFKNYSHTYNVPINTFVYKMNKYFERFGYNAGFINGEPKSSSVVISNPNLTDFNNNSYLITITVKYIQGGSYPYPCESDSVKLLLNQSYELAKKLKKVNDLNRQLKLKDTKECQFQDAMLEQIRKLHIANVHETLDCPVCLIQLDKEKMAIPSTCFHTICGECFVKCKDKCPVCRTTYAKRDMESVL